MMTVLRSRPARILTVLLLLQAGAFYALGRPEPVRVVSPLSTFPSEFGSFRLVQEGVVDQESMAVLRADDVLTRVYAHREGQFAANLFIAYFFTQRTGKTPHSPKNCLPGSGWLPVMSDRIEISVPGHAAPVRANRYVVARGENQSLVIYWYQTSRRTVASEYWAKIYTVLDAIRYNRSDAALVKVTLPIRDGGVEQATAHARTFITAFYDKLTPYFPL